MSTMDELRSCQKFFITPCEAAPYIGVNPHWIRLMAREHPERLGFDTLCVNNRVKIHRASFIRFLEGA